jgi:hypothetical protein
MSGPHFYTTPPPLSTFYIISLFSFFERAGESAKNFQRWGLGHSANNTRLRQAMKGHTPPPQLPMLAGWLDDYQPLVDERNDSCMKMDDVRGGGGGISLL